jgi:hypothetical protein
MDIAALQAALTQGVTEASHPVMTGHANKLFTRIHAAVLMYTQEEIRKKFAVVLLCRVCCSVTAVTPAGLFKP